MNQLLEQSLFDFIKKPNSQNSLKIIKNSKPFVLGIIKKWNNNSLSSVEKIRELMTEMFLILMEDFDSEKIKHPYGILNYLKLRVRRLTMPPRNRIINFGLSDDFEDMGRINLTPFRLELIREIVSVVRKTLANEENEEIAIMEFLFIHVYPELSWISRYISELNNLNVSKKKEVDKKRHQAFNRRLRRALTNLESGDWREVLDWTTGERSHLAWKIVEVAPADTGLNFGDLLSDFENWRDNFHPSDRLGKDKLKMSLEVLNKMKDTYTELKSSYEVGEQIAIYGEEPDILLKLIIPEIPSNEFAGESKTKYIETGIDLDTCFDNITEQIQNWVSELICKTSKK